MEFLSAYSMLKKQGIEVPPAVLAKNASQAGKAAEKMGFPVALKVSSPEIIHKSDLGCVKVNIQDKTELEHAFEEILKNAGKARVKGVIVQKMAPPGVELIIGGKKDSQFGQLVLFGLGGVFVEVFKDFSLRVCPIEKDDALEMIHEVKALPILKGARGGKPVDLDALAELLVKASKLLSQHGFKEFDLNPVIAYPKGYSVVDVRVIE